MARSWDMAGGLCSFGGSGSRFLRPALWALLLWAAAGAASADTLVLKDGRTYEGRLVSRDDKVVVFQVVKAEMATTMDFDAAGVAAITQGELKPPPAPAARAAPARKPPEPAGPTYFVIPIKGTVGVEITADLLAKSLATDAAQKATAVMLDIDSGGGSIEELNDMLAVLQAKREMRIVAYVRNAGSAAALFAMGCKEIVVSPGAVMGAAVIWKYGPFGTPANIEEKFASYNRAKYRSAVYEAGHDPLFVEGMMRTDIVLRVVKEKGRAKITEDNAGKVLKPKGRILTLTAREAVDCGLAMGIAETIEKSNTLLGVPTWQEGSTEGERLYETSRKKLAAALKEAETIYKSVDRLFHAVETPAASRSEARTKVQNLRNAESRLAQLLRLTHQNPRLMDIGYLPDPAEIESFKREIETYRKSLENQLR